MKPSRKTDPSWGSGDAPMNGIIALVKSAITGEAYTLPADFSIENAAQIAAYHGVDVLVYYGAICCGIDKAIPQMRRLWNRCCKMLIISEGQIAQLGRLLAVFEEKGIDAMPLKGSVLKYMYPQPEMRRMGDADVLIRQGQYPQIKHILKDLGYTYGNETDHELVWHHKYLRLELHKKMIPSRNKQYYAFLADGWHLAHLRQGFSHIYEMSTENMFLHIFTHATKHYKTGGIGIQHLTDIWLYLRRHAGLDEAYIESALREMGLWDFYNNILHTLRVWFEDGQADEISESITEFVFRSGMYGTRKNKILAEAAQRQKHGKIQWLGKTAFLNLGDMKNRYPSLDKWPVLLPVMWVVRGFDLLFFHRERISRKLNDIKQTDNGDVDQLDAHWKLVGLQE